MFLYALIFFLICNCSNLAIAEVLHLTNDNFHAVITTNKAVLVDFYAPWCGHCKSFAPEFEKASQLAAEQPVVFAMVDATVETTVAEAFQISGYPTVKLFKDGEVVDDYTGTRTAAALVTYVNGQVGPAIKRFETSDPLRQFVDQHDIAIVGFFANEGMPEYVTFQEFANSQRGSFAFGELLLPTLFHEFSVKRSHAIVLYKNFDERRVEYVGQLTVDDLTQWASENSVKLVDEIGPSNYKQYQERGLPICWLFLDYSNTKVQTQMIEIMAFVARSFKKDISFVHLNGVQYSTMAQKLGLSGTRTPALAIEEPESALHYAFDETVELTKDTIFKFCSDFKNGKLEATIRSEAAPTEEYDNDVRVVVGSTFNQIVMDPTKDVLVEFYAPWCGHCKNFAPIYTSLAQTLKGNANVIVSKIDGTKNDAPSEFKVTGFPSIYFVVGATEVFEFEGERSVKQLLTFIQEHTRFRVVEAEQHLGSVGDEDFDEEYVTRAEFEQLQQVVHKQSELIQRLVGTLAKLRKEDPGEGKEKDEL